jgi:hypothetical protein
MVVLPAKKFAKGEAGVVPDIFEVKRGCEKERNEVLLYDLGCIEDMAVILSDNSSVHTPRFGK